MAAFKVNETITDVFHHYDDQTGLTLSDFTVNIWRNGRPSGLTPTIQEIGSGDYRFFFTPDAEGLYTLDMYETLDDTVRYQGEYLVGPIPADIIENNGENNTIPENLSWILQRLVR